MDKYDNTDIVECPKEKCKGIICWQRPKDEVFMCNTCGLNPESLLKTSEKQEEAHKTGYEFGVKKGMKIAFKILEEEYEKYRFKILDDEYLFTKNSLLSIKNEDE